MSKVKRQHECANSELAFAKILHPEDISVGDDVALSKITYQYASFFWCGADLSYSQDPKVDITFLASEELRPYKVKSVCLPFVLCETNNEKHKVFDLRLVQLMKLDKDFATLVQTAFEQDKKSKRTRKSRKSKKKRKK